MTTTIYHNPQCGTSRNTLALIRNAGIEPKVVEYLVHPPSRETLTGLIARAGMTVREALREKGTPYAELGLDDPMLSDDQLIDAMLAHPILINRPFVETELGGTTVPAGANLGLLVSSANRDADVWGPTADEFNLFRPKRTHAAFGFGTHYCSGHHFSRVQMRIALTRLLERLPGLRLDPDRPPLFTGWEFRAPRHLHVLWDA